MTVYSRSECKFSCDEEVEDPDAVTKSEQQSKKKHQTKSELLGGQSGDLTRGLRDRDRDLGDLGA